MQFDALAGKIARQEAVVAELTGEWAATQATARATKAKVSAWARESGWDAEMGFAEEAME